VCASLEWFSCSVRRRDGSTLTHGRVGGVRDWREARTVADRAAIFSVIYLICYSSAAFPSLISGQLSKRFPLPQIALGYGVLALGATVITVLAARNPDAVHNEEPR
jgi:hypothetical protein